MKTWIIGDTHGDNDSWRRVFEKIDARWDDSAAGKTLIHVGDFGIGFSGWANHVRWLAKELNERDLMLAFIDGNHDDADLCSQTSFMLPEGFDYYPRGTRRQIGRVKCGFVGGAGSIDRDWRIEHERKTGDTIWWSTERITREDVKYSVKNLGWVDVLFTHDCPTLEVPGMPLMRVYEELEQYMTESRNNLIEIIRSARPKVIIHGHMHYDYSMWWSEGGARYEVYGLNCDGRDGSVLEMNIINGIPTFEFI